MKDLVSVIIPLYNSASGLERTMRAVLAQEHVPLEVILVDDGSSDNSYELARQYVGDKVQVLQQRNAGAAIARNTGLAAARGAYIQFLDAGDLIDKEKIAAQVAALEKQPGHVAVCGYKQFTTEADLHNGIFPDQSSFIYSSDDPQDFLVRLWGGYGEMNFIQTNCWLVPRTVIDRAGPWRAYRCPDDDGEFFARVLLAGKGVVHVPGVYNYYHIEEGGVNQLSRSTNHKYLMNTLLTIALKHDYLRNYNPSHPAINKAIAAQYFRFAVDMFPSQKVLSGIAWRRFLALHEKPPRIQLGGTLIETIHRLFGWRAARLIRHYLRES
jgi:glycosyltransferase involved in cell wall biosynthesis